MKTKILLPFLAAILCIPAGFAAEPAAQPQAKKTLIVFYSRTGHTKQVAENLAKLLNADTDQIIGKKDYSGASGYVKAGFAAKSGKPDEIEPAKINPAAYGLVIIGTPIWVGTMAPAVRAYIEANKATIKDAAFFTLSGSTKPDKVIRQLEDLSGKKAKASAGIFDSDLKEKNRKILDAKLKAFADQLK